MFNFSLLKRLFLAASVSAVLAAIVASVLE